MGGDVRDPDARLFQGRIAAVQLFASEAAAGLSLHGLSGAPVLVGSPEAVVGIVRWNPEREDEPGLSVGGTFYATPIWKVVERRPELERLVRARRDQLLLKDRMTVVLRRHELFGGREEELERLQRFAAGERPFFVLTARSGYGKTALLSNWVRQLEQAGEPVVYHFISRLDRLDGEEVTLLSVCEQLAALAADTAPLPSNPQRLRVLCPYLVDDAATQAEPFVVVLDGLDEADWGPGRDLFAVDRVPAGVHVIMSARTIAERNWLEQLGLSDEEAETLELGTLGPGEIARLLAEAGGVAATWAADSEALEIIYQRSAGDPFYLRYLVDDICAGRIGSRDQLSGQPQGLDGYLDQWWTEVSEQGGEGAVRDLLGYLLVALGPLTRDDLTDISDDDSLDGFVFERALARVSRYVINDGGGFMLCHPRFRDYLARTKIKERPDQTPAHTKRPSGRPPIMRCPAPCRAT